MGEMKSTQRVDLRLMDIVFLFVEYVLESAPQT